MTCSRLPVLSLVIAVVLAERDCYRGVQRMPSGSSFNTDNCERHTCRDGEIVWEFCPLVPDACTALPEDSVKIYPYCCPKWCCGDEQCGRGADITFGPKWDYKGACLNGDEIIVNGNATFSEGCEKLSCKDGELTLHRCSPVPPGCTLLKHDSTQLYPACCPSFCCGERCGEQTNIVQPGHCTAGSYFIPDGGFIQSLDCNRLSCINGTLSQYVCYPVLPLCKTVPGAAGTVFPVSCDVWEWSPNCLYRFVNRTGRKIEDNDKEGGEREGKERVWFNAALECNPETGACKLVKPLAITGDKIASTGDKIAPQLEEACAMPSVKHTTDITMETEDNDQEGEFSTQSGAPT